MAGEPQGFAKLTRNGVADRAGVAFGSVNNAYGTMDALRDAVMATALERNLLDIIAQGLAVGHPVARSASAATKEAALQRLAA